MAQQPSRGRVVMLSHTAVGPDSRVIKQLRTLSDQGWDVIIVAASNAAHDVDLRGARVRVVKTEHKLRPPRATLRNAKLRNPLAYSRTQVGSYLVAMAEARIEDLRFRVDRLHQEATSGSKSRIGLLRARIAGRKLQLQWRTLRSDKTTAVSEARRSSSGMPDKLKLSVVKAVRGDRAWRSLWPNLYEQEAAYGPLIDRLRPDIIQGNDFMMLAVGARAKLRAARRGRDIKLVWDAREYLPGMSPWTSHPYWKPAQVALEREFAPHADAVITVSDPLADLLIRDHNLPERPGIVLNAPDVTMPPTECETDVRSECGLPDDVPLVVYSGAAAPQRGLEVLIDALPSLPGTHLAMVVLPPHQKKLNAYVTELLERADGLGVSDRVHALPYVATEEVVDFLSTADLGVFPGLPVLNHTISLITKFLEYSHARLPIVVSDLKTMAETVRSTGQGEVFTPEDTASYVAAVNKVLADPAAYRRAYDDPELLASWAWERQGEVMEQVYSRLERQLPSKKAQR